MVAALGGRWTSMRRVWGNMDGRYQASPPFYCEAPEAEDNRASGGEKWVKRKVRERERASSIQHLFASGVQNPKRVAAVVYLSVVGRWVALARHFNCALIPPTGSPTFEAAQGILVFVGGFQITSVFPRLFDWATLVFVALVGCTRLHSGSRIASTSFKGGWGIGLIYVGFLTLLPPQTPETDRQDHAMAYFSGLSSPDLPAEGPTWEIIY